jgi:hypothetical protein
VRRGKVPVIFGGFDEIVDLGVYKLEDPLLGRLFVVAEFFGGVEDDGAACWGGGAGFDEEYFEFAAGGLEILKIDEDLHDLAEVLGVQPFYEDFADFLAEEVIQGLLGVSRVHGFGRRYVPFWESRQWHLDVENGCLRRSRIGWGNFWCLCRTEDTSERKVEHMGYWNG